LGISGSGRGGGPAVGDAAAQAAEAGAEQDGRGQHRDAREDEEPRRAGVGPLAEGMRDAEDPGQRREAVRGAPARRADRA
jgi:hypothetical protein